MAVTVHDHITSHVVFGNTYLFLIISDVKKQWKLHDGGDSAWPHHIACCIWQYVSLSYN